MIINRRGVLGGLASMLAAPAIVHAGNLMPIKVMDRMPLFGRGDAVWTTGKVRYVSCIVYQAGGKIVETVWELQNEDGHAYCAQRNAG